MFALRSTVHIAATIFKQRDLWPLTCLIRGRLFADRLGERRRNEPRPASSSWALLLRWKQAQVIFSSPPFSSYTMETLVRQLWSAWCWRLGVSLGSHSEQRSCVEPPVQNTHATRHHPAQTSHLQMWKENRSWMEWFRTFFSPRVPSCYLDRADMSMNLTEWSKGIREVIRRE